MPRSCRAPTPSLGSVDDVVGHLESLRTSDLVTLDREADLAYLFKHVVTQEVAYESLPFAVRAMLHGRVGRYLEATEPEAIEQNLDLLAHHFWNGDDDERKRTYLARAADAARAAYANAAAIDYLGRLVPLLEGSERVTAMLKLGKVLELNGDWTRAGAIDAESLELATSLGDEAAMGWSEAALAEVARRQGRYDEAADRLSRAETLFNQAGAEDGTGQVLHLAGTVAAQRGDLGRRRPGTRRASRSASAWPIRASPAGLYSNLAVIAEYGGDSPAGAGAERTRPG